MSPPQARRLSFDFQYIRWCIKTPIFKRLGLIFISALIYLRVPLLLRLQLYHASGFLSLVTTYVATWLAKVLLERLGF